MRVGLSIADSPCIVCVTAILSTFLLKMYRISAKISATTWRPKFRPKFWPVFRPPHDDPNFVLRRGAVAISQTLIISIAVSWGWRDRNCQRNIETRTILVSFRRFEASKRNEKSNGDIQTKVKARFNTFLTKYFPKNQIRPRIRRRIRGRIRRRIRRRIQRRMRWIRRRIRRRL